MAKNKKPVNPSERGSRPTPPSRPNYNAPSPNQPAAPGRPVAASRPMPPATVVTPRSRPAEPLTPIRKAGPPDVPLTLAKRPVAWWSPVLLAGLGFVLYINTFGHQYALDDIAAVTQNLFVRAGLKGIPDLLRTEFWHFSNISLGYYRPLSLITFALEQQYFGDNPGYSHIINALLYGLTGLFLGVLLQKWLVGPGQSEQTELAAEADRRARQTQVTVATVIGALFIAHPIHTEIVANIKGRDELLSFLFITLMSVCYWRHLESKTTNWVSAQTASLIGGGLAMVLGGVLGGLLSWGLVAKQTVSLPNQIAAGVNLFEIVLIAAGGVVGMLIMSAVLTVRQQKQRADGDEKLWWQGASLPTLAAGIGLTVASAVAGAVLIWLVRDVADIKLGQAIWVGMGAAAFGLLVTNWLGLSLLFLYLALMSKESSLVGVAFVPAMCYFFARRNLWQSALSVLPLVLVTVLFFYQKQQMIHTLAGTPPTDWANYPYALENSKVPTTFKFFAYYIYKLLVPHPLVYDYSYNVIPSGKGSDPLTLLGMGLFFALIWQTISGLRKRTLWGFGLLIFWATMMPGIGFIFSRGGIFAERFLYAPVLGYVIVLVSVLHNLLMRFMKPTDKAPVDDSVQETYRPSGGPSSGTLRPSWVGMGPLLALMVVVLGLYSFRTVTRNPDWQNNFTLFNSGLPYAPSSCQVQRHVANEWIELGVKRRTLIDTLNIRLSRPKFAARPDSVAKARRGLDTLQKAADRYGRLALDHLKASTQIYPTFGEAYFSMAYVFQKISPNADSAKYYYKQTMRAAPSYAPAYNNLGVMYQNDGVMLQNQGRQVEALDRYRLASYYYNKSMVANPAYPDGPNNRANLKKQLNLDITYLPDSLINKY
jgi:hypothetical protein